jgi:hypothetical protein
LGVGCDMHCGGGFIRCGAALGVETRSKSVEKYSIFQGEFFITPLKIPWPERCYLLI